MEKERLYEGRRLMSRYDELIRKISGREMKRLDFSNPEHFECVMELYGGEEHVKKEFPRLYELALNSRKINTALRTSESELTNYVNITGFENAKTDLYSQGFVSLAGNAGQLYTSNSIYRGEELIGRNFSIKRNQSRTTLGCEAARTTGDEQTYKGVVQVVWQPADSNYLCSCTKEAEELFADETWVTSIKVEHPSVLNSWDHMPTPIPAPKAASDAAKGAADGTDRETADGTDRGAAEGTADGILAEGRPDGTGASLELVVNPQVVDVVYDRTPLSWEDCNYYYPSTRYGEEQQEVLLDFRGEVHLAKYCTFKEFKSAGLIISVEHGTDFYKTQITKEHFQRKTFGKDDRGFIFGLPTDWGCKIPSSALAGIDYAYIEAIIDFTIEYAPPGKKTEVYHDCVKISSLLPKEEYADAPNFKMIPKLRLSWGCLMEGTKITMADNSTKKIEEIREGDFVQTKEGAARVEGILTGTEDWLWCIKAVGGDYIYATDAHPFLTGESYKKANALTPDDHLCMADGSRAAVEYRFLAEKGPYTVYNLVLENSENMIANGYVVGDNRKQNQVMGQLMKADVNLMEEKETQLEAEKIERYFDSRRVGERNRM